MSLIMFKGFSAKQIPRKYIINVKQTILNLILNYVVKNVNNINNGTTASKKYAVAPKIKNVSERVARILKQFNIHLSYRLHVT